MNLTTFELQPAKVLRVFHTNKTDIYYTITLSNGDVLDITKEHPVFVGNPNNQFNFESIVEKPPYTVIKDYSLTRTAEELRIGDYVTIFDNKENKLKLVRIINKTKYEKTLTYYNFETTTHNYFANGVLVHNGRDTKRTCFPIPIVFNTGDRILTTSGYDIITRIDTHNSIIGYYEISTESGNSVNVTGNHPILTKNGWKRVAHLSIGDELIVYDKKTNSFVTEELTSKEYILRNVTVYSIKTNRYNNFIFNNFVFSE